METQTKSIGLIIKQLAKEKNLSAIELAERMQITRQGVYDTWNKQNMSIDKISQWATALGVTSKFILDKLNQDDKLYAEKVYEVAQPDGYLMRYLAELEATVKELRETVRSQAHTIEVLAGKSDSVSLARFAIFFIATMSKFGYTMLS
ncbi:helix-turn-helix transcriptional regulator [Runella sp. MFBS21]|uniref:helix-turn-helix domain-containing protein n=1 Tax=Runella sp. MFBS21 TaxID=3034018 RepID=UPI0023F647D1|nr:helix-turn-helix transcriptional regulator [Runella sp. MFBS21]MDF7822081.1 helix-turn-helix transcriptional regulator [Runella sp. MFBS21]